MTMHQSKDIMMKLAPGADILTVIERFEVSRHDLDDAEQIAEQAICATWQTDPAFVGALVLRGREDGLAIYAQWHNPPGEAPPSVVPADRTLQPSLRAPLIDGRTYELAFTRQARGTSGPTRLSRAATPFVHFGIFTVTAETQPILISRAEAEAPNAFGTPGLLAIDFHRSLDGRQVVNLGAWSSFDGFRALHGRPGFTPGQQYFRGIADTFRPQFFSLSYLISPRASPATVRAAGR